MYIGYGGFYSAANQESYEGQWQHGFKEGKGQIILNNGCKIEGNWKGNVLLQPVHFSFQEDSPWLNPEY
jgi:hypothetical protein